MSHMNNCPSVAPTRQLFGSVAPMDPVIHIKAQLACTPQRAWELFTVNSELEGWLTTVAEVEPNVGGKYELFWNPADRENDSTIGCRVTVAEPRQVLAFEWKGAQQHKSFMNSTQPLTHVTVSFVPVGDEVAVHLVHSGWRDTPDWDEAREWFKRAWSMAFDALVLQASTVPTGA